MLETHGGTHDGQRFQMCIQKSMDDERLNRDGMDFGKDNGTRVAKSNTVEIWLFPISCRLVSAKEATE
jgi:hypothetical protein